MQHATRHVPGDAARAKSVIIGQIKAQVQNTVELVHILPRPRVPADPKQAQVKGQQAQVKGQHRITSTSQHMSAPTQGPVARVGRRVRSDIQRLRRNV